MELPGDLAEPDEVKSAVAKIKKEFGRLDLQRLAATMRFTIVLDGRNLYDPELMVENEITYFSVGRPTRHHTPELATVASRSR